VLRLNFTLLCQNKRLKLVAAYVAISFISENLIWQAVAALHHQEI
jgi:hypothetical protein